MSNSGDLTGGGAAVSIHPYKKYLLQAQNIGSEGGGFSLSNEESPTPTRGYESSPGISVQPASEYGSVLSLNNPSKPSENRHSKWLESMGEPPEKILHHQGSSNSSSGGLADESQRVSSAPSVSSFQRPSSNTSNSSKAKRKSRSVDLSHMYLMNNSLDTQLTSTNESVADLSHQLISRYLGDNGSTSLVPRLKTIEMYRENVKKSKDVNLLFQYAQYMLQTALTIDASDSITKVDDKSITLEELKKKFLKEAIYYLRKLSVKGYSDAQYLLADVYSSGALGKVENREAFSLFQAAAKHGHVESAYRTAYCFEEGLGTTRDSRKALDFLKFAASRNHPSAMYKLGLYCFYGRMGLPTDFNTKQNGIKWLSRAAARANELTCAAPYELAKIYEQGFLDIVIPDQKYAMELYIQSASLGYRPAATLLGQIYEVGNEIVTQDTSLSVHYYTQAALKGDPVAMLGLCAWYLLGAEPAFSKDENEAFQWALRAAQLGHPKSQFTLGYFYENGKGCEANMDNACKWYQRAAQNDDPRAINKVRQMSSNNHKDTKNNSSHHKKNSKSISTINLFKSKSVENLFNEPPVVVEPTGIFTNPSCNQESTKKNESGRLPRSASPSMTLNLDAAKKGTSQLSSTPMPLSASNASETKDPKVETSEVDNRLKNVQKTKSKKAKKDKAVKDKKNCTIM